MMESSCGFTATYEINGLNADFVGLGNVHDSKYDDWEIMTEFIRLGDAIENLPSDLCADQLTLRLYPTETLKESTSTNKPILYTAAVVGIFLITSIVFFTYDVAVRRRQHRVMARVATQDKIVSNLFPPTIRDRLYGIGDRMNGASDSQSTSTGNSIRNTLDMNEVHNPEMYGAKPIADLFLETVSTNQQCMPHHSAGIHSPIHPLSFYPSQRLSYLPILLGSPLGVVPENQAKCSSFLRTSMEPLTNSVIDMGCSKSRQSVIAMLPLLVCLSLTKIMLLSWPSLLVTAWPKWM